MNATDFERGFDVESYVGALRNYRSFVRSLMAEAHALPDHIRALRAAVAGLQAPARATIMTEDWCGDSACNLPILASLFDGAGVELRIHRGSEMPPLKEFYENAGVDHIPVLSIWDGGFSEIARWVEAPAAVTVRKDAWKADRPEFMDLYRRKDGDKDAARQFAALYRVFMDEMLVWYRGGMWNETTREIVDAVTDHASSGGTA